MVTGYGERAPTGHVVLDIGDDIGALIVHTTEELRGREIEASPHGHDWLGTHTAVLERRLGGRTLFAAVFPALPAGAYTIAALRSRSPVSPWPRQIGARSATSLSASANRSATIAGMSRVPP